MNSQASSKKPGASRWLPAAIVLIVIAVIAAGAWFYLRSHKQADGAGKPRPLEQVQSVKTVKDSYDVIVVGTDPEGITAAVSAARNGLKTLLVDGRNRPILGGLMTLGWLNSIDMVYAPGKSITGKRDVLNKGLFSEWYGKIEGDSFDVTTAANAFYDMVKAEKNIDLLLKAQAIEPSVSVEQSGTRTVQGVIITKEDGTKQTVRSKAVIDATQDADFAAAAGVPFTIGREDIGDKNAKMAVTVVFRLKNITPDVWKQFEKTIRTEDRGRGVYGINERSLWGFDKMQQYPAVNKERIRMRGLNGGRENGDSMLVNALQIFGIDPFDPKSRQEAFAIAKDELPHVLDYLKKQYPEFSGVELDGLAPELYVRESRHIIGEYRLSIIDVLENRDQWDRIAFGSYPVDLQRTSPADNGNVICAPEQYAIPFRSLVPLQVDGLLVVGRAASYDSLPHGSARVIPVGMAEGEAAGAAAKLAIEQGMTFRQLSASKESIAKLQERLNKQGMDLRPFSIKPQPFMEHKEYAGLKAVVSLALVGGGYKNDFHLDDRSNPQRMVNLVNGAKKMKPSAFPGDASAAVKGMDDAKTKPLTVEQAAFTIAQALGFKVSAAQAVDELQARGLLTQATLSLIANKQALTDGDTYMMIKDVKEAITGK